jgi:hypothetical protein
LHLDPRRAVPVLAISRATGTNCQTQQSRRKHTILYHHEISLNRTPVKNPRDRPWSHFDRRSLWKTTLSVQPEGQFAIQISDLQM